MTSSKALCLALFLFACDDGGQATDTDVDTDTQTDPPPAAVQLYINEFMADNETSMVVDEIFTPDWVEIYNPNDAPVDLNGWQMSDDAEEPDKHSFTASIKVPGRGFLLLFADSSVELGADHLGFGLKAKGEQVVLTDAYGRRIDWVQFGEQQADTAAARERDGDPESAWIYVLNGTPGESNNP